ncbi:MAG: gamma-glutamyltransferase [Saprospiraceae bacterium]|nr:gamma-glutamyltransferase [Saprospiraceae bacterium]
MKIFYSYSLFLVFVLLLFACNSNTSLHTDGTSRQVEQEDKYSYEQTKHLIADSAIVVTAHPVASEVGEEILRKGGNAVDAMVSVHLALAVVFPRAGNLGGGGFMIYRDNAGKSYALDFREKAPAKAHRDMYLDENGDAIAELSRLGHLASGVPGSVDGILVAHEKFGRLPLKDLVQPALELAEKGYRLTDFEAKSFNGQQDKFKKYNTYQTAFINEAGWKKDDIFVQKDLANTLKAIQEKGRAGFYEGEVAEYIVKEMDKRGGIISLEDLKNYDSKWREPVHFEYKNYHLISMPPPSSGGVILAEMLNMVEDKELGKLGFHSAESVHIMAEAERRAYADRAAHLGDMDFYPVPVKGLLDKAYAAERMKDFDPKKASPSSKIKEGAPPKESEETTHYCIVDPDGNAISVTTTINSGYGSRVVVEGAGFIMNNEMDDFSAKPGTPNIYGLVGAEANAVEAGKRMLSSMTPTIVERDNELNMVLGTPGGATIITSVYQVFLNVAEFELPLKDAVHNKRFHHQWLPDHIRYEEGAFDTKTMDALRKMGHKLEEKSPIGRFEAVRILDDGRLEGVADNRADDSASGY